MDSLNQSTKATVVHKKKKEWTEYYPEKKKKQQLFKTWGKKKQKQKQKQKIKERDYRCIVQKHCTRIRDFIYKRKKSTNR